MTQQSLTPTSPTVSITPTALSDGILYANAVPLTFTEADLYGGTSVEALDTFAVDDSQAIIAVVQLSINGHITGNNCYVVMQTDMGDGIWVDTNWCVWTGSDGSATFVFSNGVAGANTFQQTRRTGGFPAAIGSNQMALAGRIRFVGKATAVGGSSSLAGLGTAVAATIKYKLVKLR